MERKDNERMKSGNTEIRWKTLQAVQLRFEHEVHWMVKVMGIRSQFLYMSKSRSLQDLLMHSAVDK